MINQIINQVIQYGLSKNLLTTDDQMYVLNRLLDLFKLNSAVVEDLEQQPIEKNIDVLVKYAIKNNIIDNDSLSERIKFESKIMDCLMPRPSELNKQFRSKYKKSPQQATKFLHDFALNSRYIKTKNFEENMSFLYASQYGDIETIVNMSEPEPLHVKQGVFNNINSYNRREASISVNNETNAWTMQFMPYPYVEEHCLISRKDQIKPYNNDKMFEELIDFINKFPQYFIVSDMAIALSDKALLPYHYFQGGKHVFPIESAEVLSKYKNSRVQIEVLNWPVSAIRLIGNNENKILDVMHDLHHNWLQYSNEELNIHAQTNDELHNLIEVLIKLDGSKFNVYMIFKNNKKTKEISQGVFQASKELLHNNISVLQDFGLNILSKKLYKDLELVKKILLNEEAFSNYPELDYLNQWMDELQGFEMATDVDDFLVDQVSKMFMSSLEETNVFKFGKKEDFISFIEKAV